MGINLLLVDLDSPLNIGRIIRESNDLGGDNCTLYIFDPRYKLSKKKEISTTAVGRTNYSVVSNIENFLNNYKGRIIKTEISPNAIPYKEFEWENNDLILLGNENRGYLDQNLQMRKGIEQARFDIIIPMLGKACNLPDKNRIVPHTHGKYPNLSVASSAALVLSEALYKMGHYDNFNLNDVKKF